MCMRQYLKYYLLENIDKEEMSTINEECCMHPFLFYKVFYGRLIA